MPRPLPPLRLGTPLIPLILGLGLACADRAPDPPPPAPPAPPTATAAIFEDVAAAVGLDFVHWNGMTGRYYFAEMMGSGGALFDFDGDSDLDVYLVQGNLLGAEQGAQVEDAFFAPPGPLPLTDRLYRNDLAVAADGTRTLRFTDVTEQSGIEAIFRAAPSYGMGVAAADLDGDGWVDLYLTTLAGNRLLRNRGNGTFENVTAASGAAVGRWSVPVAVADLDRDGLLDLYVGAYVAYSTAAEKRCTDELGGPNYCGPLSYEPLPDTLLRNRGGMVFEDVSERAGIRRVFGPALGTAVGDFDDDGWLDVYVANDETPNQLWRNRGDGTFEEVAVERGAAVDGGGAPEASMGVAVSDFDADGDEDLLATHLTRETNTLYVNDGSGAFEDGTVRAGLAAPTFETTGFGTGFFDYDGDGDLDHLVVNGAVKVIKALALAGDRLPLRMPNQLFESRGDGTFEDVSARAGAAFALSEVSRGAAFGDVDEDGDPDVLVTNNAGPVRLLVNRIGQDRPWLGLRLLTADGKRDALGARVGLVRPGRPTAWRRVATAGSYSSSSDPRLLFGLGDGVLPEDEHGVSEVRVRWADGEAETFPGSRLAARAYTTLRQGTGDPDLEGTP